MAGVRIEVRLDDSTARGALGRMRQRQADLTPVMRSIGEHLMNSTRARFAREVAPDGSRWAPLNRVYAARKAKKTRGGILVFGGDMRKTFLHYRVSSRSVTLVNVAEYAATHQFGSPGRNIPARPFIGLEEADEGAIRSLVLDYILAR